MNTSRVMIPALLAAALIGGTMTSDAFAGHHRGQGNGYGPCYGYGDGGCWEGGWGHHGHARGWGYRAMSDAQRAKFDKIMEEFAPRMEQLRDSIYVKRQELRALENATNPDVKAVREAVGPDVDLLVEVHRRLSPYHAIHFSERIQEFNPFWIEEPCLADNIDLIAQAHAGIKAPVVTGETLYNKEAFIPVFEKHAAEIINPDICVSGIKVMSEISAMAEPYSVLMSPHNFNSNAVGLAAMIHLSASIPNFLIGEMFLTVDEASREIMVEPFEIKNGYVALPTKPGLGIDIDMDKLSQRPYKFFERKFPFKGACDYRDEFPKEGM